MIDLTPAQLEEVKNILAERTPGCEVWAFGSRVRGNAHKNADLDLAVLGREKLDGSFISRLQDAFSISNLPFLVDIVDWQAISDDFRSIISSCHEVLQRSKQEQHKQGDREVK